MAHLHNRSIVASREFGVEYFAIRLCHHDAQRESSEDMILSLNPLKLQFLRKILRCPLVERVVVIQADYPFPSQSLYMEVVVEGFLLCVLLVSRSSAIEMLYVRVT